MQIALPGGAGRLRGGQMGAGMGDRLTAAGYTGPMPGTPEFKAARAAGQTPIRDWRAANPQAGGGNGRRPRFGGGALGGMLPGAPSLPGVPRNTGIVPPGYTVPMPAPVPTPAAPMAEGGRVRKGKAKAKSKAAPKKAAKMPMKMTGKMPMKMTGKMPMKVAAKTAKKSPARHMPPFQFGKGRAMNMGKKGGKK
jgi:hypothetical protein